MAQWPLWRWNTALAAAGRFSWSGEKSKKAKVKRQKYCGGLRRHTSIELPTPLVGAGEQVIIAAAPC